MGPAHGRSLFIERCLVFASQSQELLTSTNIGTPNVNRAAQRLQEGGVRMSNKKPPLFTPDTGHGSKETHESYGMVGLSRQSWGAAASLFGSSIRHNNIFSLRIRRAERHRHLNRDWYHAVGRELIEVLLSPTQLVDLITSANVGDGVPCTLHEIAGEKMDGCPSTNTRQQYEDEFKDRVSEITNDAAQLAERAASILDRPGTVKKSEKDELLNLIDRLVCEIRHNVPFVQSSFNESVEQTVTEAKGEVEAFFTTKIASLGLEALEGELRAIVGPNTETLKVEGGQS